ncbi:MAG TPA: hypothetical protein VIB39_21080 [Candidatus Angelobacter sp.]|jgi:hypothetical protein
MSLRSVPTFLIVCLASIASLGQNLAPPTPERITIHSKVLNEDRAILVRMPAAAQNRKDKYPVLFNNQKAPDEAGASNIVSWRLPQQAHAIVKFR